MAICIFIFTNPIQTGYLVIDINRNEIYKAINQSKFIFQVISDTLEVTI